MPAKSWDANAMQELIPAGFVLVVVLRHVVRQARLSHSGTNFDGMYSARFRTCDSRTLIS